MGHPDHSARPARYQGWKGEYKPGSGPYLRPGADHSHMPHSHDDQEAAVTQPEKTSGATPFHEIPPADRRLLVIAYLVASGPRTIRQLADYLQPEKRAHLDPFISDMKKRGLLQRTFRNGVWHWEATTKGAGLMASNTTKGAAPDRKPASPATRPPKPAGDTDETASPAAEGESLEKGQKTCPDCNGDGEGAASMAGAALPCPTCDATGTVELSSERKPLATMLPEIVPGRIEHTAEPTLERWAVTNDGALILWINGELVELDPDTTRQLRRSLARNAIDQP
ncbi:MAG: hypothetical protein JJU06_05950 [Ectothiorhodospiraceae bacterium]|nr:hypothetical protein [Ectothiorhodospiraceae bacterium]